jgi:hypothetical protein
MSDRPFIFIFLSLTFLKSSLHPELVVATSTRLGNDGEDELSSFPGIMIEGRKLG